MWSAGQCLLEITPPPPSNALRAFSCIENIHNFSPSYLKSVQITWRNVCACYFPCKNGINLYEQSEFGTFVKKNFFTNLLHFTLFLLPFEWWNAWHTDGVLFYPQCLIFQWTTEHLCLGSKKHYQAPLFPSALLEALFLLSKAKVQLFVFASCGESGEKAHGRVSLNSAIQHKVWKQLANCWTPPAHLRLPLAWCQHYFFAFN